MESSPVRTELILLVLLICLLIGVNAFTNENDFKILNDFMNGMENPELLKWPAAGTDPCGPPSWPHVFCSNSRVTQIQVQGLGLKGLLPQNLNQLDMLMNLGLQRNRFTGKLPSFSGLSNLQFAYLDFNEFETIPADFFQGLSDVRVLALDYNPFNESGGWSVPSELAECSQLVNFSCSSCNIIGPVPEFFGTLASLTSLRLSGNRLTGEIPSSFRHSMLQILWLNNQDGGGMAGSIDVITSMVGLTQLWLHGNQFTGAIPDDIAGLTSLRQLNLNGNRLVGLIPLGLASMELQALDLNNNMFMGSIPKFKAENFSYESNSFCQSDPGLPCAPEVTALLMFLQNLNYPERLASEWSGNDPCRGPWWGITCGSMNEVSVINLKNLGLNGTLGASLVNLPSLVEIRLEKNNLHGLVPSNLTLLRSLRLLDISGNDFQPPLPRFREGVNVITDGNPRLTVEVPKPSPSPLPSSSPEAPPLSSSPSASPGSESSDNSSYRLQPPRDARPSGGIGPKTNMSTAVNDRLKPQNPTKYKALIIVAATACFVLFALLAVLSAVYCFRRHKTIPKSPVCVVIHPKDSSDPNNMMKITVVDSAARDARTGCSSESRTIDRSDNTQATESKNLIVPFTVLRKVTNDFAQDKELGRGGFGVVYKGELEDGTNVAVKRMEAVAISSKALDEFQVEIAVLSKVRHRHLVTLLGYSAEGNERLLVYEFMSQGALSKHLFRWNSLNLPPLSWTKRLSIALDVARGVEYLHGLAHHSFIHRDLKSANILLDEDFRAKVSDFGLVKLAPDRDRSVATRLAGTFGYLAPEYAVTGKISTKVDVFSFGVVLMELLTGLVALDEQRPEENRYLAEWFWQIKSDREMLIASIDPSLDVKEDTYESIYIIAELAGHCTAREASRRPDMGHAVSVLAQLVDKWKPCDDIDQHSGIDMTLPLPQMLKGWQEADTRDSSGACSADSKGSIPAKPSGFADSFTSADAR